MTTDALSSTLFALADPTRRGILARLATGDLSVKELAEPYAMSMAAVSKHIKVLEAAGLVRRTRQGREHTIELDPQPLREVTRWASRMEKFWTERLDRIERFFEEKRKQK